MDYRGPLPLLLTVSLVAACESAEQSIDEPQIQTSDPVGLYRGEVLDAGQDRLCITPGEEGGRHFALVKLGPDGEACAGAGDAQLSGDILRLSMGGDEPCEIEATMLDLAVRFPETVPDSCAYYCSPAASLAGMSLTKVGGTLVDAREAKDLVGDPLCR